MQVSAIATETCEVSRSAEIHCDNRCIRTVIKYLTYCEFKTRILLILPNKSEASRPVSSAFKLTNYKYVFLFPQTLKNDRNSATWGTMWNWHVLAAISFVRVKLHCNCHLRAHWNNQMAVVKNEEKQNSTTGGFLRMRGCNLKWSQASCYCHWLCSVIIVWVTVL